MNNTRTNKIVQKMIACMLVIICALGVPMTNLNCVIVKAENTKADTIEESTNDAVQITNKDNKEEATIRFLFTTDLHGTVSSMDLVAGTDFSNSGLSLAINLIRQKRDEMDATNVFTFDIGDVLLDASTEYIYSQDSEVIQPIYQAMTLVGYDAITLGNHEFDWGKDYLLEQLNGSGLMDKVVLSNLTNFKDGSYPFAKNMIFEREVVTESGQSMKVKVGVIGETIPTLSTKTENYAGIWATEDILENTSKEAKLLKEQGADIVVVLAHSGFGKEEYTKNDNNASYYLTLVNDVDVVLCGHEHSQFPSNDKSIDYYKMPGVDKSTGLVNGKALVMAQNNAYSIGMVDLTLGYDSEGELTIKKQQGSVLKTGDYKLTEDQEVLDCLSEWSEELEAYRTNELIQLADGVTIQNYLGILTDTAAMQMQNDARIAYARKYIETLDKTYSGYPVLAVASHISYGANGKDDYVNINGSLSYADLFTLQNYRNMTYLYKVTGAQIKEWLELSASIYSDFSKDSESEQHIVNADWINNWANFYVFDGINYTINPYVAPRYNAKGEKINNTTRVSNILYNGKEITDDMEFVVACNSLSKSVPMFSWASAQQIRGAYRTQVAIAEYLSGIKKLGAYTPEPDNNWSIKFKEGEEFTLFTSCLANDFVTAHPWYNKTLMIDEEYAYYAFKVTDTAPTPLNNTVIAPSVINPIMTEYKVFVDTFSVNGIKTIKYSNKKLDVNSFEWRMERDVTNHGFMVYYNGTYYVYVEDLKGNKEIIPVVIDNIGSKDMAKPTVWAFNNKKAAVTGKGEAGATVVAVIGEKEYTGKVLSNNTFSLTIPALQAGDVFYVYLRDEKNDRQSDKVKVNVRRSGPNPLTVNKYYNNQIGITGKTNDENVYVVAIVDDYRSVYVPKGTLEVLLNSTDIALENYSYHEVDETIEETGDFILVLPNIPVGTSVRLFNLDYLSRLSKVASVTIQEGGPYAPEIDYITNGEKEIHGYVKSTVSGKAFDIIAMIGENTYTVKSDVNGYFTVKVSEELRAGDTVEIYAKDTKDGKIRSGRLKSITVTDISSLPASDNCKVNEYTYGDSKIVIETNPGASVAVSIPYASGRSFVTKTANANGIINIYVSEQLIEGDMIYVTDRDNLGKLTVYAAGKVKYKQPGQPILLEEVTNKTTKVKVATTEDVSVVISDGTKEYCSTKGTLDAVTNQYMHTITISKTNSKNKLMIYAKNVETLSNPIVVSVSKLVPDAPVVDVINVGSTEINGTVEIFLLDDSKKATVKNSKTKVFAKINNVNYQGTVNEDGTFSIMVPTIEPNVEIKVYAYNNNGYGPTLIIK